MKHPDKAFQKELGHKFRRGEWLDAAFTHPSFRHEGPVPSDVDNQRLEFLGDAVLGLLAAECFFAEDNDLQEGDMTQLRSMISNRDHLAEIGRRWEVGPRLKLGKGEASSGGADRDSNLADAVEAILGAAFLDGGMRACRKVFKKHWSTDIEQIQQTAPVGNPKGALQEWAQKQNGKAPSYRIVNETGPQHDRSYEAVVTWNGEELARGTAPSKRAAEAEAARVALDQVQPRESE